MKNRLILAAVLVIVGMGIGFAPTYFKFVEARHETDRLSEQLRISRRAEALNGFRNRAALLYLEAGRNNYTVALDMASRYFTDIRAFADETADPALKQELGKILTARDAIIAGLAKADPTIGSQLQELFIKLQKIN